MRARALLALLLTAAVSGCGGSGAGTGGTATTSGATAVAGAALGDRHFMFTHADCVELPAGGIIANAWNGPNMFATVYRRGDVHTASLQLPDASGPVPVAWIDLAATVAFSAPTATATGSAHTLAAAPEYLPLTISVTCPAQRGNGSGTLRIGSSPPVHLTRVGCVGEARRRFGVGGEGRVGGRTARFTIIRTATTTGFRDHLVATGAIRGTATATGTGALTTGHGLFTKNGDHVEVDGAGIRLVPAGGGTSQRATASLTCGLDEIR
ncbi:MAG: hypothetical protein U0Y82_02580 [Thermoleophilia bacterium]